MQKNYAAANKPKRDDAKAKELADLRRENHELRRTVKRLYKEVGKRVASQDEAVVVEEPQESVVPATFIALCECGVQPLEIALNSKIFLVCPECKARKKA
jgi:hypothetical protein